ncbi:FAD-binding oxidoreductase [Pelagibius litoralis]|uniref:FAD-binding oxidoreductase n=1 Tax=Pelagibius litoralis TaxID=374515 RepID=A0A967F0J9_9PROT|nr:FAD-binding oxidoreductase [Pelagibius litoralis]NIA70776.1 FAD-binding oxidoreductase [Pelagibius litoralis]
MDTLSPKTADYDALRRKLTALLGEKGVVGDAQTLAPFLKEQRGRYEGHTPFMIRPADTQEVSRAVALCAEAGVPLVPQGGNTGLVAGAVPFEQDGALLINLGRMNRVRNVDPTDYSITVEAGCILQSVQQAAEAADRLFPLSLGAEGSCQIGGNLSTNAGGIHVLRYGNTRDLVLGLEVVLADGRIWEGLSALRKDNTGYDLKHLFVGAEGTLGIITAATLKLFPRPRETAVAFIAVTSPEAAVELLARSRAASGDRVAAFELIPRIGLDFALRHVSGIEDPLGEAHDWYVLTELASGQADGSLRDVLENLLATACEDGLVIDAALAANERQAAAFWRIREGLVEGQKFEGGSIKHDVSVPVSKVPLFLERALALVKEMVPGIRPVSFGHLGDGNIHFNLSQPEGADKADYLARWDEVNHAVHSLVVELDGSISAEHGIGHMKVTENAHFKSPLEIEMMQRVKAALDPQNLMNPGKVVPR